jgi:hypothetical protein
LPVSMFAAGAGPWGHGYITCFSDPTNGGVPCTTPPTGWKYGGAGTSFAAPIWAGIQALINQHKGASQGLPNYRLYQTAATEWEYNLNGAICPPLVSGAGGCVFHDVADISLSLNWGDPPCGRGNTHFPCWSIQVVPGDNDVPCEADKNGSDGRCPFPPPSGRQGSRRQDPRAHNARRQTLSGVTLAASREARPNPNWAGPAFAKIIHRRDAHAPIPMPLRLEPGCQVKASFAEREQPFFVGWSRSLLRQANKVRRVLAIVGFFGHWAAPFLSCP